MILTIPSQFAKLNSVPLISMNTNGQCYIYRVSQKYAMYLWLIITFVQLFSGSVQIFRNLNWIYFTCDCKISLKLILYGSNGIILKWLPLFKQYCMHSNGADSYALLQWHNLNFQRLKLIAFIGQYHCNPKSFKLNNGWHFWISLMASVEWAGLKIGLFNSCPTRIGTTQLWKRGYSLSQIHSDSDAEL